MLLGLELEAEFVYVVDDFADLLFDGVRAGGLVLLQGVEVFQEEQPGGLLGVVQFAGAVGVFPEDVVDVFEGLFEHEGVRAVTGALIVGVTTSLPSDCASFAGEVVSDGAGCSRGGSMPHLTMLKLLLIDDHFVVRSGLVASLELEDDMQVVAEADRGEEAVALFAKHQPEVVLMDLQLGGISGVEATAQLKAQHGDARVLIFSTFARDDEVLAALKAGALGYLQKSASRDELLKAIRMVAKGQRSLPADLEARLALRNAEPEITPREREILALIAKGNPNKEIGAQLGIAEDTVKRHVSSILDKLQVNDRAQATAEAIRRGIVKA